MKKKSQMFTIALIWIAYIVILLVCGAIWIAATPAFEQVDNQIGEEIGTNYSDTREEIRAYWNNWPILFIIVLTVVCIVASLYAASNRNYG